MGSSFPRVAPCPCTTFRLYILPRRLRPCGCLDDYGPPRAAGVGPGGALSIPEGGRESCPTHSGGMSLRPLRLLDHGSPLRARSDLAAGPGLQSSLNPILRPRSDITPRPGNLGCSLRISEHVRLHGAPDRVRRTGAQDAGWSRRGYAADVSPMGSPRHGRSGRR